MIVALYFLLEKRSGYQVDLCFKLLVRWGLEILSHLLRRELFLLCNEIPLQIWKESQFFLKFFQRIFLRRILKEPLPIVFLNQRNHPIRPLNILIDLFAFSRFWPFLPGGLRVLNRWNIKLTNFCQENDSIVSLDLCAMRWLN